MIGIPFHLRPPPGRTLHSLVRTFASTKPADLSGTQDKSTRQKINFHELKHPSKVPQRPNKSTIDGQSTPTRIPVDAQTVQLLERLSLIQRLEVPLDQLDPELLLGRRDGLGVAVAQVHVVQPVRQVVDLLFGLQLFRSSRKTSKCAQIFTGRNYPSWRQTSADS
ncbi:hypothetical protein pipiens_016638 [Culex pipiens pipiens]|uniref:Uncharacterized protein n=1 Tax=Culex pipiens pipiens TaxID=38569 RepID=A0ABD1CKD7_CULPP